LTESVTDTHTHRHTHTGKFTFCPCLALNSQKWYTRKGTTHHSWPHCFLQ